MNPQQLFRQRAIEGAKRYAKADRSDPFAFTRALAHLRIGIVSPDNDRGAGWIFRDHSSGPAVYDAREAHVGTSLDPGMVFSDGSNTYHVTEFREVTRP